MFTAGADQSYCLRQLPQGLARGNLGDPSPVPTLPATICKHRLFKGRNLVGRNYQKTGHIESVVAPATDHLKALALLGDVM